MQLYKQLESLHGSVNKESTRYNTLQRRAVKVAGDKRKEKVTLMPVYNKKVSGKLVQNNCLSVTYFYLTKVVVFKSKKAILSVIATLYIIRR